MVLQSIDDVRSYTMILAGSPGFWDMDGRDQEKMLRSILNARLPFGYRVGTLLIYPGRRRITIDIEQGSPRCSMNVDCDG